MTESDLQSLDHLRDDENFTAKYAHIDYPSSDHD